MKKGTGLIRILALLKSIRLQNEGQELPKCSKCASMRQGYGMVAFQASTALPAGGVILSLFGSCNVPFFVHYVDTDAKDN